MNQTTETAVNPAITRRETRVLITEPNEWDRILFTGDASNKFQILRRTRNGKLVTCGAYDTLAQAVEWRDALSLDLPAQYYESNNL